MFNDTEKGNCSQTDTEKEICEADDCCKIMPETVKETETDTAQD